jgi:hypothetical protein
VKETTGRGIFFSIVFRDSFSGQFYTEAACALETGRGYRRNHPAATNTWLIDQTDNLVAFSRINVEPRMVPSISKYKIDLENTCRVRPGWGGRKTLVSPRVSVCWWHTGYHMDLPCSGANDAADDAVRSIIFFLD